MENSAKIALVAIVVAVGGFFGGLLVGYGVFNKAAPTYTLSLGGSTTVYPIAVAAADEFMTLNPNYNILVSGGGSGVGLTGAENGTFDIADSSSTINSTLYPGLNVTTICMDGIAIIVNTGAGSPAANIQNINESEVKEIYNGSITNWDQLPGGGNHAIDIYERESGSGTRTMFESKIMGSPVVYASGITVATGSPAMVSDVAGDVNGIGYVGIGYLTTSTSIRALGLSATILANAIPCTFNTVHNFTYPLWRYLFMATKGNPTFTETAFMDFMLSPIGQQIAVEQGFVTLPPGFASGIGH